MRESRTSGSTSGVRRRSMDELVRHRQPKGSATDMLILNHRAASRLYQPEEDDDSGSIASTSAPVQNVQVVQNVPAPTFVSPASAEDEGWGLND